MNMPDGTTGQPAGADDLSAFRDIHAGKRCFIVGNGPSLNKMELSYLEGEITFCCNSIFLLFDRISWRPTYYTCVDSRVIPDRYKEINDFLSVGQTVSFFPATIKEHVGEKRVFNTRDFIRDADNTYFFNEVQNSLSDVPKSMFSMDVNDHVVQPYTVTITMLQIAAYMGFSEIYLIGCDTSYVIPDDVKKEGRTSKGEVGLALTSTEDNDPNHFDPRYFGKGRKWHDPQVDMMIRHHEYARQSLDRAGINVYNATVGGALEVYPRRDFSSLFSAQGWPGTSLTSDLNGAAEQELLARFPKFIRYPIFMPTDKISAHQRIEGLKKVIRLYEGGLRHHRQALRALRENRTSDRCFIIGNGPSLNRTDLTALAGETTFATNGFFLKFGDIDWRPSYYVVEDHLVAEDRAHDINSISECTKLFPAYLSYCLNEDDRTIFFDHRPRLSFPDSFDFSTDASHVTYAGCTVTFTCMQIASFMGFKEIYLVGVDSDYSIPGDAQKNSSYGTDVLDMDSDDKNHFHPDYFGKGYRWHDPQVDKMIEAYREARNVTEQLGQNIYNATVGGMLEVFERRSYEDVVASPNGEARPSPSTSGPVRNRLLLADRRRSAAMSKVAPRLLVLDLTRIGDGTATGEIKSNLLSEWPSDHLLQVYAAGRDNVSVFRRGAEVNSPLGKDAALAAITEFAPDVILYRPVPDTPALHALAMQVLKSNLDLPLATWIMDDWPARLEVDDPAQFASLNRDWLWLVERSSLRLSISSKMSDAFRDRYGLPFLALANGVEPADWPEGEHTSSSELVIRYAGALASNMTAASVLRTAQAVERLAKDGHPVRMEIRTRKNWHDQQQSYYAQLKHTQFITREFSAEDYRKWLREAGAVVIAYNFDEASLRYITLSMANKLPECLASGAPVLVHGPSSTATIDYLRTQDCALIVEEQDDVVLRMAIKSLVDDEGYRRLLGKKGRQVAFKNHNLHDLREKFLMAIDRIAREPAEPVQQFRERPRSEGIAVDETEVVSLLLAERVGHEHLMLDVGAHFGTSAAFFERLGWTIHCFEPDPSNREKLVARLGKSPNVTIDTRAVSDKPATGVSFFKSDESTGISGLHAFRDTHREDGKVDITTVAEVVEARGIEHVDFLKIDVEGFDFSVLKGVPWDRIKPDVIECEFEDYKTVPLGHTYKEVAQYLVDRGYTVYLSEWHPIVRYGIRHDFRRVIPFPGIELQSDAWGNILAFRQDPGLAALNDAFEKAMSRRPSQPAAASPATAAPTTPAATTPAPAATTAGEGAAVSQPASASIAPPPFVAPPAYVTPAPAVAARPGFRQRAAEKVRARSLPAFHLALFALWCLRKLGQRPFFSILALALPVATAALAYFYPQQAIRLPAVAVTSGLLVLYASAALVGYLATRVKRVVLQLREEFARSTARQDQERQELRSHIDASARRLSVTETGLQQAERAATHRINELAGKVDADLAAVNARFTTLDHFATSFTDRMSQLEPEMARRDKALETRVDAAVEKAVSDTSQLVTSVRDQIQSDIAAIDGKTQEQIEAVNAATGQLKSHVERVERAYAPSPTYNPGLYQHFGRRLTEATAREMAETWSKLLGTGLSRQRLGYLANRSCVLESSMKGRLATAIETVVLRSLVAAAPKRPDVSILEIGTLFGVGAAAVYEAVRNDHDEVHLTVLDPLDGYYGTGQRDLLTGAEISEATLRENFAKAPVPEQDYTVIKRLSTEEEAFEEASKRAYDVLIIDGDHSYEGVKYDFDRYGPLVREGGYILFDDYDVADWPDIKRYVDEEILPRTDVELVGAGHRTAVYRVKTAIEPLTDAQAKADMRGNAESN